MKLGKTNYKTNTIVLRSKVSEEAIDEFIERKKKSAFRSFLHSPEKSEIHVHSLKLIYEPFLVLSGIYTSDFYRKAIHTIKVPSNVKEVILGEGTFPIRKKSEFVKKLTPKGAKNKVDMELEEHVFIEDEKKIILDHHGKERSSFKYNLDPKNREHYPQKILSQNEARTLEITVEQAADKLTSKLRHSLKTNVRELKEDIKIQEILEIYVPYYEARLIGPKKQVKILRVDAVRKEVI